VASFDGASRASNSAGRTVRDTADLFAARRGRPRRRRRWHRHRVDEQGVPDALIVRPAHHRGRGGPLGYATGRRSGATRRSACSCRWCEGTLFAEALRRAAPRVPWSITPSYASSRGRV